ncbi:U3 small nucleolar ribonucleoprotein protein MPP10 [Synchiropus splendidus]|uniref:U3 small nucleolar ribonucleoprotein protein MPP10 n=1 Tax=Synchiropus splendidus TaxID=270530 RepID=UPI00237DE1A5|nr:U3 small nucleolar ribonucleoprotein protein MPP10 [Synchiropus splendidus]
MAKEDTLNMLEECFKKLNHNTTNPEDFLSLQNEVAADFTSITKSLYDLHKSQEPGGFNASPLAKLVVEHFDEEQIWQELELQNAAVLKRFKIAVESALSDEALGMLEEQDELEEGSVDEEDDNEQPDDEEEEQPHGRMDEDITDEDSDLDFDVDALEQREKQKQQEKNLTGKSSKLKAVPSEVDDRFFKLSEMESFLDDMDKKEGKENADDIDYFQDLPSDNDDGDINLEFLSKKKPKKTTAGSSRNFMYKDYFNNADGAVAEADEVSGDDDNMDEDMEGAAEKTDDELEEEEESDQEDETNQSKTSKKVTFNLSEDDSEGEDLADIFGGKKQNPEEVKSSFEKRQEKMSEKIDQLEKAALGEKSWQMLGEVTAERRPENSMLEEDLDFEQTSRMAPAITEETTLQLEDIIKQRIKDQAFDDVVRKEKPKEEVFEYKKRLTLDHEKSKQSLAEIYEQEYLKQNQQKAEEEENPAHVEIQKLMDTLFMKLDALSNFHFTPKPSAPEVKVVSNLPSITMEEVAPVTASDATLLAPEEIKDKNKAGDVLGASEKTATDKKRERRHKKKVKQIKIKEKEKRQKLRDASKVGENKRPSKAAVAENLKKLTKGGKATILKDEGKDKALRSSQAFFSQLQDQVKSQIKSAKDQSSKKKKLQDVSVSKLKL